ncbi:MAG: hypothetical protein LBV00_01735, partial [Propionibacteriaceae bacterium]|nr:hypothetical protein [Propionibacteriaceae bacterium]
MGQVMINIDELQTLINNISTTCTQLMDLSIAMRGAVSKAREVAEYSFASDASTMVIEETVTWLQSQRQPLQSRLDLATSVASSQFAFGAALPPGTCVVIDEAIVKDMTDIIDAAKKGKLTDQQWQDLVEAAADPGTAGWVGATLYNNVTPEQAAVLIQAMSSKYDIDILASNWEIYQTQGGDLNYTD